MRREGVLDPHDIFKSPKHWRMRAEEARAIAESAIDPTVTGVMLRIAASYDRLADRADASAALDARLEAATRQSNASTQVHTLRRVLRGAVFDHRETALLSQTFDAVAAELDLLTVDRRERAARAILELFNARRSFDADRLRDDIVRLMRQRA